MRELHGFIVSNPGGQDLSARPHLLADAVRKKCPRTLVTGRVVDRATQ
jgi:hypothetical protein